MPRGRTIGINLVNPALQPSGAIDHSQRHNSYLSKVSVLTESLKAAEPPGRRLAWDKGHLERVNRDIAEAASSYANAFTTPESRFKPQTIAAHEKEMRRLWRKRDELTKSIALLTREVANAKD